MRILITGGGSGGHSYPLVAVSQQILQLSQQNNLMTEIYYLGAINFSQDLLDQLGIKSHFIFSIKLRRYFSFRTIWDLIKLPFGLLQILFWLYLLMPDVIFSKGGPGSFLVVLGAWLYRIPVVIHESDSVSGLNNRLSGRIARTVFIAFDKAKQFFDPKKTFLVGNPLRAGIFNINTRLIEEFFKTNSSQPILLVIGGSQGAQFINEKIISILPQLTQKYQVIHVCGLAHYQKYQAVISQLKTINQSNYHLYNLLNEEQMFAAYALANLVLARSGAGAIFELAYLAKPSILIPLPDAAGDHQKINAYDYIQNGAGIVLEQPNLTEHVLLQRISALMDSPERLSLMAQAARNFAKPDAAVQIAQAVLQYAT